METIANNIILYVDGKPVLASNVKLSIEPPPYPVITCTEEVHSTFEFSGLWEMPELTPIQEWQYQWYRSGELPRKEKKAYRKKLLKML